MVAGHDGPAVGHLPDVTLAGVDHRLDGEDHARHQFQSRARTAVVQHLRLLVELFADAVATEFAHYAIALLLREGLNGVADVAKISARLDPGDAVPHGFERDVGKTPRLYRRFTGEIHAAGVAMIAVLDDRDVDVDDVTRLQHLVARHAVAHLMVDRRANGFRVGRVSRRRVVEWRGNGALHVHHVLMAQPVQFAGADAWLHMRRNEIEHLTGQAAGDAHFFNIFGSFDVDGHDGNMECVNKKDKPRL